MENKNKNLYMNIRSDFAFKRLFGSPQYSHLLMRFLNSFFKGNKKIATVEFKNKEVLPPGKDGKRMIYDIYCTNQDNEHFILEMQNLYEPFFENRAFLYAIRALSDQIKAGGDYYLDPVYAFFFTNFDFEHMKKHMVHEIGLVDRNTGESYSDVLNMMIIPMSTVKDTWDECNCEYEQIVYLIKNMHTMTKESEAYKSKKYDDFFEAAEIDRLAAEDVVAYSQSIAKMEETERAFTYAVERASAESYVSGFAKGETAGRKEEKKAVAANLLKMGMDVESISAATKLSVDEIETLKLR